jgi:zinc-finger of a C2HC-type
VSLCKCTTCGRTFNEEAFTKHVAKCGGITASPLVPAAKPLGYVCYLYVFHLNVGQNTSTEFTMYELLSVYAIMAYFRVAELSSHAAGWRAPTLKDLVQQIPCPLQVWPAVRLQKPSYSHHELPGQVAEARVGQATSREADCATSTSWI